MLQKAEETSREALTLGFSRQLDTVPDCGESESREKVPNPPPSKHHRHTTQSIKERKGQDQSKPRILNPNLDRDSPPVTGWEFAQPAC